jgi:hypothetical protein
MPREDQEERPRRPKRRPTRGSFIHAENYTILCATNSDQLAAMVRGHLDDGWQVAGGVTALPQGGLTITGAIFYQAMLLPVE